MSSESFMVYAGDKKGSANNAFRRAVLEAEIDFGTDGYTGSIAEKEDFIIIDLPRGQEAESYAQQLLDKDDDRISDKWGPAGCIKLAHGRFLFFGNASA